MGGQEQISLKNGVLFYKRKLKPGETYRIDRKRKYTSLSIIKKTKTAIGISSRTQDGYEVLFLDYDAVDLSLVKSDFNLIQELFGLGPAYLFTTKLEKKNGEDFGNFHVICLTKRCPADIVEIMKYTHIDTNYFDSPMRNRQRCWILRISNKGKRNKPNYLGLIGKEENLNKKISSAHKKLLSKLYNLDHPDYSNEDNLSKFYLQEYETV